MIQKYFKKTLAGIFAIAIVTSSVPLTPYTSFFKQVSITASAETIEVGSWDELQTKINEAVGGEETLITLTADIIASDTDSYINVAEGKVIVLDLNGYTLDRGLSTATEDGYVIRNNGTLTICDESEKQTGKITGGKCSVSCGGIYNYKNSTLTINGGSITGNTSSYGGGIYNYEGTITINGGSITGNTSSSGGGIYNNTGTLTINGGSITENTSSYGGGIYNYKNSTLTINGGSITGNTSSSAGGGIYNHGGTLTINDGSITGNTSSSAGGGIYNNTGTLTISGGSITGNTSSSSGGGIYNYKGTLTISDGSITGNTSSSAGGGIYNSGGTLTISDGSITGNTTSSSGGGIYNYGGTLTINGGNISDNTSKMNGGGIYNVKSTLTINGGNISDNTAQSEGGGIYNIQESTLTITGGNITGNSAATYGGGIMTYTPANITVGGSAIINGNLSTHSSDGIEESNIHLNVTSDGTQAKLQISETTPLTNSANIGITVWLASGWGENTDISTFIDGLTADNAKQIFATNCGTASRGAIYYITAEDDKFVTTTEKPAAGNTIPNSTLTWEINDGVLTITGDDEAFPECWVNDAAVEWCDKKDEVKEVVFNTPNMTKLGSAAFYEFPMAKITLPDTLTEIGYAAFKHCAQLKSLDIPNGVKEIPGSLLEMEQDESNGWASITSLTSISMAPDVTKINGWAFANCTHVTSFEGLADSLKCLTSLGEGALMGISISDILIYIPETLNQTSIGRFTFNGANLGTDLEIPSFITELGENAFGWANLEHVIIPASVLKIDKNAFIGWGNLKTITLKGAAESVSIDDEAFSGNNVDWNTMTFYVPASQVNAYKNMTALEGSNVIGQATATFDLGGKGDNFTLNTDENVKITEPTAPTADDVVFAGWYTDNTYETKFNFNDALTDDKVTIYAKWDAIPAAKGYSVSYNGDVTINFHLLVFDSYKNGYVKFSDNTQVSASDAVKDANGYYVFPISMPAKNMYDEITAQFYDANDMAVGEAVTFDLVTYMDKVKAYDSNLTDFVDSFLEYGQQAAAYFGNTNAPTSTKTYDYNSIISVLADEGYDKIPEMSSNYVGATMLLKSTPILRLYYKDEVEGLDLGDNAKWATNEMNSDLTFIQKEISATDFDTTFNGYSVYNYFYKVLGSGDEQLMKLCASLYELGKAANDISK